LLAELDRDDGEGEDGESERPRRRSRGAQRAEARPEPRMPGAVEEPIEPADTRLEPAEAEAPSAGIEEPLVELEPENGVEPASENRFEPDSRPRDALPLVVGESWSVSSEPISLFEPAEPGASATESAPDAKCRR
jgi:hypothetical protein